jgi:hypothetical protein
MALQGYGFRESLLYYILLIFPSWFDPLLIQALLSFVPTWQHIHMLAGHQNLTQLLAHATQFEVTMSSLIMNQLL